MTSVRPSAAMGVVALLALLLVPVAIAEAEAATVVPVPATIDATGARDVTDELNRFFATVPTGATVQFPPAGRFRIDGVVFVTDRHDVTIDGRGSTLVAPTDGTGTTVPRYNFRSNWPRLRQHLDIENSSGITVRDLVVQGPNGEGRFLARFEGQAGFAITRSTDVTLDGVTARNTFGDGVYVIGHSIGVRVRNCTLDHNGRQGVAVVDGEDITVERCSIVSPARSAIDLEPARGAARKVHIQDNEVRDAKNFLLAAGGAGVNVGDVWLERNRVIGGRGVSVYAGQARSLRSGIHILDNTGEGVSKGYQRTLLRFERFDGIEVRGNRQAVAKNVAPITLINSCNADIGTNDFGPDVPPPVTLGDCAAPGLAPVTSSTTGRAGLKGKQPTAADRRAAALRRAEARRRAADRRAAAKPEQAPAPDDDDSALPIVLALVGGVVVGAAGVVVVQRIRRRSQPAADEPDAKPPEPDPAVD